MRRRFASAVPFLCVLGIATAQETPTGRITGHVLDALGNGVTAARVRLEAKVGGETVTQKTVGDVDGMFVFSKVPLNATNGYVKIVAESKGRCPDSDWVRIGASNPEGWSSLRLWDAGAVDVTVVDEEGRAVEGATVIACAHDSRIFGLDPNGEGTTDREGKVHFAAIPLGGVDIRVRGVGRPFATSNIWLDAHGETKVTLPKGDGVSLALAIEGLPEGKEAELRIYPYDSGDYTAVPGLTGGIRKSEGGAFAQSGLPDLEYRITPSLDGFVFEPREHRLAPGSKTRSARFVAKARTSVRLHGVLRDEQGVPRAGVRLRCRASNMGVGAEVVTADEGKFEFDSPLGAGEKAIVEVVDADLTLLQEKTQEQYGSWDARFMGQHEFLVDAATALALTAIPSSTITGRAVDAEGKPLRGRRVELQETTPNRMPQWMTVRSTTTAADGRFTFRRVYPLDRPQRISLGALDSSASEAFMAKPGETVADLTVKAMPLGVIEGRIVDGQGRPRCGMRVWLRNWNASTGQQIDGSVIEVLSDHEGRYRFLDVEPGGHRVEAYGMESGALSVTPPFEVDAGATVTQDFHLSQ
ncbi:MAG: carboxypeptidase-like regulatory domain-containing protein [Planctomycetota bacterium]